MHDILTWAGSPFANEQPHRALSKLQAQAVASPVLCSGHAPSYKAAPRPRHHTGNCNSAPPPHPLPPKPHSSGLRRAISDQWRDADLREDTDGEDGDFRGREQRHRRQHQGQDPGQGRLVCDFASACACGYLALSSSPPSPSSAAARRRVSYQARAPVSCCARWSPTPALGCELLKGASFYHRFVVAAMSVVVV